MQIGEWHPWSCTPTCAHVGGRGLLQVQGQVTGSRQWGAAGSAQQQHAGASAVLAVCCGLGPRLHMAPGGGGVQSAPHNPWMHMEGMWAWGSSALTIRQGEWFSLTSRCSARRSISSQGSRAAATSCLLARLRHRERWSVLEPSHCVAPHHCRGSHSSP